MSGDVDRSGSGKGGLSLHDLTVSYHREPAVHHLSGTFEPGSLTAIVGPNGAGKSTLLAAIMGLVPLDQGRIELAGIERDSIAYLPQRADIDRSFPIRVADVVSMGLWRRSGAFGGLGRRDLARIEAAIEAVGLTGLAWRPIGSLSVGQFQRALFARVIVEEAALIILDEPFAGLDARTSTDLIALISDWHRAGRTVIAVLHDLDMVLKHFPSTLILAREPIAWGSTQDVLTPESLARARVLSETWIAATSGGHGTVVPFARRRG